MPEEKPVAAVVKGLPPDITEDEILAEIKSHNPRVTQCTKLIKNSDKYPYYLVKFEPGVAFPDIRAASPLFHTKVYWENFNPKRRVTQCFNCQLYGHGARQCNLNPRCLKCGADHKTMECKKPKETPPQCTNCQGDHLSNYTKCPTHLKYIERIDKRRALGERNKALQNAKQNEYNSKGNFFPPISQQYLQPNPWTTNRQPLTQAPESISDDINDLRELSALLRELKESCNIKLMILKLRKVIPQIKNAINNMDRLQALMTLDDDDNDDE